MPARIPLTYREVVTVLIDEATEHFIPIAQRRGTTVLRVQEKDVTYEIPTDMLWRSFGKNITRTQGTHRATFTVPSVSVLTHEVTKYGFVYQERHLVPALERLAPGSAEHVFRSNGRLRDPETVNEITLLESTGINENRRLLELFERLGEVQRGELFSHYQRYWAVPLINVRLRTLSLASYSQQIERELRNASASKRRSMNSEMQKLAALSDVERHKLYLRSIARGFGRLTICELHAVTQWSREIHSRALAAALPIVDIYFWEEAVAPSASIQQFLPPGTRILDPIQFERADAGGHNVGISGEVIDRSESRVDPTRLTFYTERLGCKRIVRATGAFAHYEAFLLRSAHGARYALLDTANVGNAVYIFRIDPAEDANQAPWIHEAQKSKSDVLRDASEDGPFVRRIFHSENWMERIERFLQGN